MYKNFSNYEVFENGQIWSKVRKKWLKPQKNTHGYLQVNLYDNEGKMHTINLHKVVYFAVNGLWEYPEGMQLNHKNESKTSNEISNLELVSAKDNANYGTRTERQAKSMTNHPKMSKRVGAFNEAGELVLEFPSTREAGRNGYCQVAVAACCRNCYMSEGNNKYKGFNWRYLEE